MLDLTLHHQLKKITLDVSFQVGREVLTLFGPSGSGKSITLQMIAGLVRPDSGQISLNGRQVFDSDRHIFLPPQQRRVGYVMQDYTLFPHLSVSENIAYGLRRNGSKQETRRIVADMLDLIQLPGFADHRTHELSGGQQQRVALARALVINPEILLLDEPFSALDGPTRAQLRSDLHELLAQVSIPTLFVTHDLAEANLLADRIAVYHQGKLLQVGTPAEVMHRPANLNVARLTGTQNYFAGTVKAVMPEGLQLMAGSLLLDTPFYPFAVGESVQCCIRPEQVLMLHPDQDIDHYANVFQGEVVTIMSDGLSYILQLRLVGGRLYPNKAYDLVAILPLQVHGSLAPKVGQVWRVLLKQNALHLMGSETVI